MVDVAPGEPPAEVAEELMIDPASLARSDVELEVHTQGDRTHIDLCIGPDHFGRQRVRVPSRFVDDNVVDLTALVEWLGLPTTKAGTLRATATLKHDPNVDGDGGWTIVEANGGPILLGAYSGYQARAPLALPMAPEAGDFEATEPSLTGEEHVGSYPRPAIGDTDAWPDDVEGWREAIRRLRNQNLTLRAGDVRMFFAGLDDEVLELTEDGPINQMGNPAQPGDLGTYSGDSWDPATDSLDPALEEALRLEGVPGALPPPDEVPAGEPGGPETSDNASANEDIVDVSFDNTVAIVEGSTNSGDGSGEGIRIRDVHWWWVSLGIFAFVLIVGFFTSQYWTGDDAAPNDSASPAGQTESEPAPPETAEEALQRATQELLDSGAAEVEQTFTVATAQGQTVTTASGAVDWASSESRLEVTPPETRLELTLEVVITPEGYFVRPVIDKAPWVEAMPGEIGNNPAVADAGLAILGIGETFDPVSMGYLAAASKDVTMDETSPTDVYLGTVTLPVTGEGADNIDRWIQSVFGRGQRELAGVKLRTELSLGEDGKIEVKVVLELEDAIDFMGDDPLVENLRGITLTNETTFTPGGSLSGATPQGQTVSIDEYLQGQTQPGG